MHNNIQISKLNDFIFCPYSIYYHGIYESFHENIYHDTYQKVGKISHKNIEDGEYSSATRYLQGITIYSDTQGLIGKIDIYDKQTKTLIERKYKVQKIYDGYKYQLYAQMLCLKEMGYQVKKICIHSLSDNTRHALPLPDRGEWNKFLQLIETVRNFKPEQEKQIDTNPKKCAKCIYYQLCDRSAC
jgi:CRISPR-associated protein Cas4